MANNCCATLSKVYMITTNLLFACLGLAFIAFGLIGIQDKIIGATLFPDNTFKLLAILGAVIIIAAIIGIIGAFVRKTFVTYLYMFVIICALIFQAVIGVRVYQSGANAAQYLNSLWPTASVNYRANLQNQFQCCGLQTSMDNYAPTSSCQPNYSLTNILPPCAPALQAYIQNTFRKVYLAVFAALALELLALTNAITLLCSGGSSSNSDEESERRKRRKSGIRLDDMSSDTIAGSYHQQDEQKNYYAGNGGGGGYQQQQQQQQQQNAYATPNDDFNRNNRYDSYDMYRHNNNSNHYSDSYNNNTINNNRHGNGNGGNGAYY